VHNAVKTLTQDKSMTRRFVSPLTEEEQRALTEAHQYGEKRALRRRAHAMQRGAPLLGGYGSECSITYA